LILTYDEAGGLYDHVVPASIVAPDKIAPMLEAGDKVGDFAHSGFRVPLVVVSPWVKPHYVSHTWRDYTSILRLIEVRFNVAPLTARDRAADDMMEFFNFNAPSWSTPPSLPAQPTNGACDTNLERAPGR
jgi:phospholipase C